MNVTYRGVVRLTDVAEKTYTCFTSQDAITAIRSMLQKSSLQSIEIQIDHNRTVKIDFSHVNPELTLSILAQNVTTEPHDDREKTLLINAKWEEIMSTLRDMDVESAVWLSGATQVFVEKGVLYLCFESKLHIRALSEPRHRDLIAGVIQTITRQSLKIVARYVAPKT